MSNVVKFPLRPDQPSDPQEAIAAIIASDLEVIVSIGWNKEGTMIFVTNQPDKGDILWLLEQAKLAMLTGE